jgi:hypothetical protein
MSRLLFRFALIIIFLLTLISLVTRTLGSTQPSNPLMSGFTKGCESQPQPCWYGIVPGVTTMEEVRDRLLSNGYAVDSISELQLNATKGTAADCQSLSVIFDSHVRQINIAPCQSVVLGDFAKQFGRQEYSVLDPLSIWYQGVIQIVFRRKVSSRDKISYHTPLQALVLFPNLDTLPQRRGPRLDFLIQQKYCQLQSLKYACSN